MRKLLNYLLLPFLSPKSFLQKNKKIVSYLKQNSKTKYLLKIKTAKCSLSA